jgi:hypothetical protein
LMGILTFLKSIKASGGKFPENIMRLIADMPMRLILSFMKNKLFN